MVPPEYSYCLPLRRSLRRALNEPPHFTFSHRANVRGAFGRISGPTAPALQSESAIVSLLLNTFRILLRPFAPAKIPQTPHEGLMRRLTLVAAPPRGQPFFPMSTALSAFSASLPFRTISDHFNQPNPMIRRSGNLVLKPSASRWPRPRLSSSRSSSRPSARS